MREPVGYLWTQKYDGKKELRSYPPADLPWNREHWEWEPVYVGAQDLSGVKEFVLDWLPSDAAGDDFKARLICKLDLLNTTERR